MKRGTKNLRGWAVFLKDIRSFFDRAGFCEVWTDCLVPVGAVEPTLDSLEVRYTGGQGQLHTSPEFEMKRLLVESPYRFISFAIVFEMIRLREST